MEGLRTKELNQIETAECTYELSTSAVFHLTVALNGGRAR